MNPAVVALVELFLRYAPAAYVEVRSVLQTHGSANADQIAEWDRRFAYIAPDPLAGTPSSPLPPPLPTVTPDPTSERYVDVSSATVAAQAINEKGTQRYGVWNDATKANYLLWPPALEGYAPHPGTFVWLP